MRLHHIVGMVIAVFGIIFANLIVLQISWSYFTGLGILVSLAVLGHLGVLPTSLNLSRDQSNHVLSTDEAFENMQDYLDGRQGKRPLDPHKEIYDRRRTLTIDGEKHVLYAVIGKEKDYERNNKQNTVRGIWCCLHDKWWGGDDYVPGKHRRNPFYGIERFSHAEGYPGRAAADSGEKADTNVYVNSGLDDNGGET